MVTLQSVRSARSPFIPKLLCRFGGFIALTRLIMLFGVCVRAIDIATL